jgi:thiamine-phosphate pyrophosphorylase
MEKTIKGLYVITPAVDPTVLSASADKHLRRDVEFALLGGARIVQYRDKSRDSVRRLTQASELLALCNEYDAMFIVNDDVELAAQINAHGVHLGGDDTPLEEARRRLGRRAIIGASCYNRLELAIRAQNQSADYVAFGRFFPSRTKPQAVQADRELLQQAKRNVTVPVVAIGGITAQNGGRLVAAGADMLAVVDAVFAQKDITTAARQLAQCFSQCGGDAALS